MDFKRLFSSIDDADRLRKRSQLEAQQRYDRGPHVASYQGRDPVFGQPLLATGAAQSVRSLSHTNVQPEMGSVGLHAGGFDVGVRRYQPTVFKTPKKAYQFKAIFEKEGIYYLGGDRKPLQIIGDSGFHYVGLLNSGKKQDQFSFSFYVDYTDSEISYRSGVRSPIYIDYPPYIYFGEGFWGFDSVQELGVSRLGDIRDVGPNETRTGQFYHYALDGSRPIIGTWTYQNSRLVNDIPNDFGYRNADRNYPGDPNYQVLTTCSKSESYDTLAFSTLHSERGIEPSDLTVSHTLNELFVETDTFDLPGSGRTINSDYTVDLLTLWMGDIPVSIGTMPYLYRRAIVERSPSLSSASSSDAGFAWRLNSTSDRTVESTASVPQVVLIGESCVLVLKTESDDSLYTTQTRTIIADEAPRTVVFRPYLDTPAIYFSANNFLFNFQFLSQGPSGGYLPGGFYVPTPLGDPCPTYENAQNCPSFEILPRSFAHDDQFVSNFFLRSDGNVVFSLTGTAFTSNASGRDNCLYCEYSIGEVQTSFFKESELSASGNFIGDTASRIAIDTKVQTPGVPNRSLILRMTDGSAQGFRDLEVENPQQFYYEFYDPASLAALTPQTTEFVLNQGGPFHTRDRSYIIRTETVTTTTERWSKDFGRLENSQSTVITFTSVDDPFWSFLQNLSICLCCRGDGFIDRWHGTITAIAISSNGRLPVPPLNTRFEFIGNYPIQQQIDSITLNLTKYERVLNDSDCPTYAMGVIYSKQLGLNYVLDGNFYRMKLEKSNAALGETIAKIYASQDYKDADNNTADVWNIVKTQTGAKILKGDSIAAPTIKSDIQDYQLIAALFHE